MSNRKNEQSFQATEPSIDSSVSLSILTIDGDCSAATRLAGAFARLRGKTGRLFDNMTATNIKEGQELFDCFRPNVIFIDITTASENVNKSSQFVLNVRKKHRGVVFVLYSDQETLNEQCQTYTWWTNRLRQYYRLNKGGTDEQFDDALSYELEKVGLDLQIYGAIRTIESALEGDEPFLKAKQVEKIQKLLNDIHGRLEQLKTWND